MVDIHSHILFGVDDGARDEDESHRMLLAAKGIGIKKIIATPHIRTTKPDITGIKRVFAQVKQLADNVGIDLLLGYEVHTNALADTGTKKAKDFRIDSTNSILLELDSYVCPLNLDKLIFELQRDELSVIIAHPERYVYIQRNTDVARRLYNLGCVLQIDAESLTKPCFSNQYRCAVKLIEKGMVNWIASDAHNENDYRTLERVIVKKNYRMHY